MASKQPHKTIRFRYEIAFQTDTPNKAHYYQKFTEITMGIIRDWFKGKPNKVTWRLIGKDYTDEN